MQGRGGGTGPQEPAGSGAARQPQTAGGAPPRGSSATLLPGIRPRKPSGARRLPETPRHRCGANLRAGSTGTPRLRGSEPAPGRGASYLRPSCRAPLPGAAQGKETRTRTSLGPRGWEKFTHSFFPQVTPQTDHSPESAFPNTPLRHGPKRLKALHSQFQR